MNIFNRLGLFARSVILPSLIVFGGCANKTVYDIDKGNYNSQGRFAIYEKDDECFIDLNKFEYDLQAPTPSIDEKTYKAFLVTVRDVSQRACTKKIINLNTRGGEIFYAKKIAEVIRSEEYDTVAPFGRQCASSCGLIFISGVNRYVRSNYFFNESSIGFHQISLGKYDSKMFCAGPNHRDSLEIYYFARNFLPEFAAENYYRLLTETPCDKINWVSANDLLQYGIATHELKSKLP